MSDFVRKHNCALVKKIDILENFVLKDLVGTSLELEHISGA